MLKKKQPQKIGNLSQQNCLVKGSLKQGRMNFYLFLLLKYCKQNKCYMCFNFIEHRRNKLHNDNSARTYTRISHVACLCLSTCILITLTKITDS